MSEKNALAILGSPHTNGTTAGCGVCQKLI